MAIHIKSASVEQLARKLSKRTGETLTAAIGRALEDRMQRLESGDKKAQEKMLADLRKISKRSAKAFRKLGKTSTELLDELYGDDGLPR